MAPITMAEVWIVIKNSLWILGLSVLLATWSYARYTAYETHVKTRYKLNEPKYALTVDLGLLLFVAGMATTETRWWAQVLWIMLAISIIVQRVLQIRAKHAATPDTGETPSDNEGPAQ